MNALLKNRIAVSGMFLMNGFLYASWTCRLPELQQYFGINNAQLGTVLFCIALGSIIAMPVSGWLAAIYGSDKMSVLFSCLFACCIPLIPVFQNIWAIRLIFVAFGMCTGSMDVTMNGQAVLVERLWGKSIFASFHAIFSIGMTLGAATGALFSRQGIVLVLHLAYVAAAALVTMLWIGRNMVKDAPHKKERSERITLKGLMLIFPFGIMGLCCMTGEGSMVDWSAIFTRTIVKQSLEVSSWALGTFGIAMTLGRSFGDYFINSFGKFRMLVFDTAVAICGMCIMLGFPQVYANFLGIFLVGIGLSTVVPIVFSSAGNIKGIAPSVGISTASSIGYVGFFIGPPVIGYLAETFSLRLALGFVLMLFILLFFIVLLIRKSLTTTS
jgi:predicted MFS family arabinose efflux permease